MKPARVLACCLLVLPLVGTVSRSVPYPRAKSLASTPTTASRPPLESLRQEGLDLLRQGRYSDAQTRFEALRDAAMDWHELDMAARAAANVGACEFAGRRYRPALRSFLAARKLAESAGDTSETAIVDINLGSLYTEMGDLDSAVEWTERSLRNLSGRDREMHLPEVQVTLACLRARQNRLSDAVGLFHQAIAGADRLGDLVLYTLAWNRLGEELLKGHLLPEAETAFLEAYRVRKLHHLPLDSSYRNLGRLRLEQGDVASASALLDRAVELAAAPRGLMPTWDVYHYRGRVRLEQGRLRDALDDLRISVRLARAWRWSIPPDEASRVGAEGWLDQVHSALIEAGNRLYLETGDPALLRETFEAAEENRASSLRALLKERQAQIADLPASYWEATGRLQRAEIAALRSNDPAAQKTVKLARAALAGLEASRVLSPEPQFNDAVLTANRGPAPAFEVLDRAESAMDARTVLLSFQLGDSASWLWALDRGGLALISLPPRGEITSQVQSLAQAIQNDSPEAAVACARLYRTLFGGLDARFRSKPRWLLSLDPALLDVPIAALVEEGGPRPVYVAERHVTEVIPGLGYWLESAGRRRDHAELSARLSPLFVGIGDPVYNAADPRFTRRPRPSFRLSWSPFLRPAYASSGFELTLPRLVASSAELDSCAKSWSGESILLKGADACRRNLIDQLGRNPAVVHFATHVLRTNVSETHALEGRVPGAAERPAYGLIALSLTDRNEPELLQPQEIAGWKVNGGLVVLSGCDSSGGTVLQGTGLMGLTRSWLVAGAQGVVSSLWATPDEDGVLFRAFYRNLSGQSWGDPVRAWRDAQVAMIRSGGWRARPRYWGAYFMVGSE